ncbi:MAG: chemotaxis protein CheX [Candidatus Fibromonas sp.]|jgi:chemotaxis protein CheX|nr:chemotaxis protein CheX [Candidatus Fibromonas sp.]
MKAEHINPFLKSTIETFKTMVGLTVTPGKLYLRKEPGNADISSVIGLSGDIRGAVVMAYPVATALKLSSKFLGEEIKELNASVADCIGEISNIITGFAKKDLQTLHLSISLPSIVRGQGHVVDMPKEAPVMCVPYDSEIGSFIMEVSMVDK